MEHLPGFFGLSLPTQPLVQGTSQLHSCLDTGDDAFSSDRFLYSFHNPEEWVGTHPQLLFYDFSHFKDAIERMELTESASGSLVCVAMCNLRHTLAQFLYQKSEGDTSWASIAIGSCMSVYYSSLAVGDRHQISK